MILPAVDREILLGRLAHVQARKEYAARQATLCSIEEQRLFEALREVEQYPPLTVVQVALVAC